MLDFVSLCSSFNIEDRNDEILLKLGKLMDESHNRYIYIYIYASIQSCVLHEPEHLYMYV